MNNKDEKVNHSIEERPVHLEDEFYKPLYDETGRAYPPPEAVFDYYDENYYYELVE